MTQPSDNLGHAAWTHRPDIEGLRAVAVVLVVLFHASIAGFSGGFVGVDVFFVISGFLITGLLLRELQATGTISLSAFYARRARRLLPAAALVLVVTLGASILVLPPLLIPGVATDTAAAAAYISNMRFAMQATDYFAAGQAPSPILHYWSLGVEEQFYLFWPAILLVVAGGATRLGRRAGTTVLAVSVVSFAFALWLTSTDAPWAFFSLPTRAWELGLGAGLAVAGTRLRLLPEWLAAAAGWLGLALIALAGVALDDSTPFPGLAALLPAVGAALVVAGGARPSAFGPTRLLGSAIPRFLGRISYSLYLWHWPLLVLPAAAVGAPLPLWARVGLMVASVVLAAATQRWVEDPFRRGRHVGTRPRRNLAMAGALSLAVAVMSVQVGISAAASLPGGRAVADPNANEQALDAILNGLASEQPSSSPGGAHASSSPTAAPTAAPPTGPVRPPTVDRAVPSNVEPALTDAPRDYPESYLDGCHTQEDGHPSRGTCLYGDLNSSTTIALFGDSHALAWFPAVERVAERQGWRLLSLTMSTCSPADLSLWNPNYKRVSTECSAWRERTIERLVQERPAIVLVTGTRGIEPIDSSGHVLTGDALARAWQAGMARTLNRLVAAAGKVIVVADAPLALVDPPVCLSQHPTSILACSTPVAGAINQAWLNGERAAAERAGAGFIDPTFWICPTSPCPPVIGNILVDRDRGHLTSVFSAALSGRLGQAIEVEIAKIRSPARLT